VKEICKDCKHPLGTGFGCETCGEVKRVEAHAVKQIPLKPCPFCGKQPDYMINGGWSSATIKCRCGIRTNSTLKGGFPTDRELVNFWNTRTFKNKCVCCMYRDDEWRVDMSKLMLYKTGPNPIGKELFECSECHQFWISYGVGYPHMQKVITWQEGVKQLKKSVKETKNRE